MRKAYDTFLLSEVSADLAAKAGSFEPYRYECAHCGEEVRLAAICSKSKSSHFRHRSGNSDVECEYYLGHYDAFSTDARSRKSKSERAEFYFDSNMKMFFLGLRFSEDEIAVYEHLSTVFELRESTHAQPFYSLRINSNNFTPDVQRMISLDKFSYNYFLSNTFNNVKRNYEVFNKSSNISATFFKIKVGDCNSRGKLVRSAILYTNTPYFVVYQKSDQYWDQRDIILPDEIKVEDTFKFETMRMKFLGKVLSITSKTPQIDSLLLSWGYQLEVEETLTLLWPPAIYLDDTAQINANYAYLYSTFEIQAHGNINIHSKDIDKLSNRLSKISVITKTKIYKKNTELMLEKYEYKQNDYTNIPVAKKQAKNYGAVDGNSFLFCQRYGVSPLSEGMTVQLTPESEVRHYKFGYLDEIISALKYQTACGDSLLQDILMNYKRTEIFKWEDYESLHLSQVAFQYIETCKKHGQINSAVKYFIEEGLI